MDKDIFSGSSDSGYRIEGADSQDHEPEPQKNLDSKKLPLDKVRSNDRQHGPRYIETRGPKSKRSSSR